MPLIVDAHVDLAWNMLTFGRDYTRAAAETRTIEAGSPTIAQNGDTLLGWPDLQRGRVAVIFSTLFAAPLRHKIHDSQTQVYGSFDEARRLYRDQLSVYRRLTDAYPDKFRLIHSAAQLNDLLQAWRETPDAEHPVGMVVLMEGGEGIQKLSELEEWHGLGLRLIGPAWVGTRYCGGWKEPGPLTEDGRKLLNAMANFNFILDLSHMDEQAALEALDSYRGPVVVTHANCLALLPDFSTNRQLSDRVIRGVIERDGVVGVVPYSMYLKVGWTREGSERDEVHLEDVVRHMDHICQLAGDALHVGIGSDFDGGFGVQSAPAEIDTVADLQKVGSLLTGRGYAQLDAENILGGNWLARLRRELPRQ